ncbi:MAG: hypothetical protein UY48_C0055G0002 [Candidatus Gottesmanbacteria bacterium GW2011_GWB1_49_7]|uniref:Uncharacterized protein n=1 Tax=Candidatus Gottesmanbacteria bacterium GW2011_GWB1_49_7 TaxID=1618448 RepID=A0A0G1YTL7_9BACT|nr:MAG: hypothetical protein UY48_C0055G0002 [Candidatus Gottesmanbacteria bacterium GW2011_GWB1_49_7]
MPTPGGLFDQHPQHLEKMVKVLEARNEADEIERKRSEAKSKARSRA